MMECSYETDCKNESAMDYEFCIPHLQTPRGRMHIMDVVQTGQLTLQSEVDNRIAVATELSDADYITTSLEKMANALDTIVDWKDEARRNLDRLGGSDRWRYTDRAGQEQQHTFLGVWERSLDRLSRHLGTMGKQALGDKVVTLGKAQVDMMIRLMMAVITEMQLSNDQTDKARQVLLEKLGQEANLVPRVERHAEHALALAGPSDHRVVNTGGVTSVSIRGEVV